MRTVKTNIKYNQILSSARGLFWKHGLKRVTVEEISKHAGVSKMTFYKFFPNKVELAKAVYNQVADEGIEVFKEIMNNENTSAPEKMEQMLLIKMEGTNDISREFLADFYSNPELGLSKWVEEKSIAVWKEMIGVFKNGQEKGWFRRDFKPEVFLLMINKFTELITDENIMRLYETPQQAVMEFTRFFTYGIMPYKSPFNNLSSPDNDESINK